MRPPPHPTHPNPPPTQKYGKIPTSPKIWGNAPKPLKYGKCWKNGKTWKTFKKCQKRIMSQNHARNDRGEILSGMRVVSYPNGHFLKNAIFELFFLYFPRKHGSLGQNMGLWVKSGWYGRSGLVVRSSAHNPKLQVRSHLPPLIQPLC